MENKYKNNYVVPGSQTEKFWLSVFHEIEQKNWRAYI